MSFCFPCPRTGAPSRRPAARSATRWSPCAIALLAALGLPSASEGCGKHTVPFKREPAEPPPTDTAPAAPPAAPLSQAYPPQTSKIEVGSRTVKVERGALRASLELPATSASEQPTLLVIVEDGVGGLLLHRAESLDETAQEKPAGLQLIDPNTETCSIDAAGLRALGPQTTLVEADLQCALPKAQALAPLDAAIPSRVSESRAQRRSWVISLEPAAHILKTITTLPGDPDATLHTAVEQRDLDDDGHQDLLVRVSVGDAKDALAIDLKLFERAGGWVRESDEPEHTLRELADRAATANAKRDGSAAKLAARVLQLHRALCREPGEPQLLLDGRGIECGASLAAGRAGSIRTAELAHEGRLAEALRSARDLEQPFYQLAAADVTRAQQAVRARAASNEVQWQAVGRVDTARAPTVRRGALAFVDDGHLLIRGPTARMVDLGTRRIEPVGIAAGLTLTDPTGRFAITGIERDCDGFHFTVVRAGQIVAGIVTGPVIAHPLFATAPVSIPCERLTSAQRRDSGGYHALEWTTGGVIVARDQSLFLLTLDANAQSAAPATPVGLHDPLPGLTHSAELTENGGSHIWVTPDGIAIHDRTRDSLRFVAAPTGPGVVTDVAISPSTRVLALLRAGELYIGSPPP